MKSRKSFQILYRVSIEDFLKYLNDQTKFAGVTVVYTACSNGLGTICFQNGLKSVPKLVGHNVVM